jgi:hypothetical protein
MMIKDSLVNPDYMQEQTLIQGGTYTYTGNPTGTPIKVTIVWTDPAGDSQSATDDRTARLVNDLDLRVSYGGTTFEPWVLDVENPTAAATKGDNVLDNVEQVSCPAGTGPVTVTVTNKGALLKPAGTQDFSIIVSGIASSKLTDFSVAPDPVVGGVKTKGQVTISSPAPGSGVYVNLSSNVSRKIGRVPSRAFIKGGNTVGTFDITTYAVTSPQTITVTAEYGESATKSFTVNPVGIQSLLLDSTSVSGGNTVTGTVVIGQAAPSEGAIVRLASNIAKAADVDWKLVIPAGQTSATFTVRTFAVKKATDVVIRAAYPGPTKYATLKVLPPFALSRLSLVATSAKGKTTVQGTVIMNGPAPTDTVVTLTSSNTAVATVPTSVTIPAGSTQATFSVTTLAVKSNKAVTITAAYNGAKSVSKLTVKK